MILRRPLSPFKADNAVKPHSLNLRHTSTMCFPFEELRCAYSMFLSHSPWKLQHLAFPSQTWQPLHPLRHIKFCLRLSLLNLFRVVKRSSLNENDSLEGVSASDLEEIAPAILTEGVRQSHTTVLNRGIRLGLSRSHLELVLWNKDVGGKDASTDMAACRAMTDGL